MTLGVYARQMRRRDGERERLRALVEGADWAPMGTTAIHAGGAADAGGGSLEAETPADAGASGQADEGTRTLDLLHGKQTL